MTVIVCDNLLNIQKNLIKLVIIFVLVIVLLLTLFCVKNILPTKISRLTLYRTEHWLDLAACTNWRSDHAWRLLMSDLALCLILSAKPVRLLRLTKELNFAPVIFVLVSGKDFCCSCLRLNSPKSRNLEFRRCSAWLLSLLDLIFSLKSSKLLRLSHVTLIFSRLGILGLFATLCTRGIGRAKH